MNLEIIFGGEPTKEQEILFYSAIVAVFICACGVISYAIFSSADVLLNFFFVAIVSFILPIFLHHYLNFLELTDCEKYFPVFLDDIKEAKKSGISFPEAIKSCRGNYGKLDKHVKKLRKDISWGVAVNMALNHMKKNLKKSQVVSRSISVLTETYLSGGNLEEILGTLTRSLIRIIESENYRKNTMQQHVFMMYAIFLMYIGLIIILGNFLIPMISDIGSAGGSGASNLGGMQMISATSPCTDCSDILCTGLCSYYNLMGGMFGFGEENSLELYYKSLFLTMILIQGFFTGLIAGQISSKSWVDGAKHGIIMFFIGLFIIILTNMLGIF
ncbi:MAG: type II secretion system F family protein [Candidatus Aenigmarchaeota archaeon]|nr:type II secretion system F family protein [Candidatus Aenigmarchaeota archaeon]